MQQILPHLIWLGHAGDARDLRQIFDAGIRARVELAAEEAAAPTPHDLLACRFPLIDGSGNDPAFLTAALRTVACLLEKKIPTLVCCSAGTSRSPVIVAGAIALLSGKHPEECLLHVLSHHPADVQPALWNEVVAAVRPSA
jgi:protein-tyrosine phosphatase